MHTRRFCVGPTDNMNWALHTDQNLNYPHRTVATEHDLRPSSLNP